MAFFFKRGVLAVATVFAAGPHHGDGAGGSQWPEGQSYRGVRSCPSLFQRACIKGTFNNPSLWLQDGVKILCKQRCCCAVTHNLLSWSYLKFIFVFHSAPGGEGSVIIGVGRRGDQMGDHCPGCMETTSQTVHERGSILGRNTHNGTQAQFCYFKSKFMCPLSWNQGCTFFTKNWFYFGLDGYRVELHLCDWKEMPQKKHEINAVWIKVQIENHFLFSHTLSLSHPH